MKQIIADLHCDLLSYLTEVPNANPFNKKDIGCNIPDLVDGNIKLQVMAIYTATQKGSRAMATAQSLYFQKLIKEYETYFCFYNHENNFINSTKQSPIQIITAIENAAGLCEEDEPIETIFIHFNKLIETSGKPVYIGLTHHTENRFGGGNVTKVGLKNDGKLLLDYLSYKNIAIDLSHTSDTLAIDILNYVDKQNLQMSIIASHSNFRVIQNHPRNLPDEIAQEIIRRKGLIGINFLRAILGKNSPQVIYEHIEHGLKLGAQQALCFGADYFHCDSHPDQNRKPFFYGEHENATKYQNIFEELTTLFSHEYSVAIACENVGHFLDRNYFIA